MADDAPQTGTAPVATPALASLTAVPGSANILRRACFDGHDDCRVCGKILPVEMFVYDATQVGLLRKLSQCHDCFKLKHRQFGQPMTDPAFLAKNPNTLTNNALVRRFVSKLQAEEALLAALPDPGGLDDEAATSPATDFAARVRAARDAVAADTQVAIPDQAVDAALAELATWLVGRLDVPAKDQTRSADRRLDMGSRTLQDCSLVDFVRATFRRELNANRVDLKTVVVHARKFIRSMLSVELLKAYEEDHPFDNAPLSVG
jgi:hypothetical protein